MNDWEPKSSFKLHAKIASGDLRKYSDVVPPPEHPDNINHPSHYNQHPSGIECIDVVEHMSFNLGNAIKYIWRADHKGNALEDLEKARWYIEREISRRNGLVK